MKNVVYASRQVFQGKIHSVVRIVSLVIGFSLSALMLTRYAYDLTYDEFYPHARQIYMVYNDYSLAQQSRTKYAYSFAPLAQALKEELPSIEAATRFWNASSTPFLVNHQMQQLHLMYADASFFEVFAYEFIQGSATDFAMPGTLFLSESKAVELFGEAQPLQASLLDREGNSYTVRAIFKDIPQNSSWKVDAVAFVPEYQFSQEWGTEGWVMTALKLPPDVSIENIDNQIDSMTKKLYDPRSAAQANLTYRLYLYPLSGHHQAQGSAAEANRIIIILGILILFVSGLNYVLLNLSRLNARAREMAVHKCSGASKGDIFMLLFNESLIYCLIAFALSALLLMAFRSQLEMLANGPLTGIFALENCYATVLTAVLMLALTSLLPAFRFASVPISQVFRQSAQSRVPWKMALLFIQLCSTIFIANFLWMTLRQTHLIFSEGPGYEMANRVVVSFQPITLSHAQSMKSELEQMQTTERKATLSSHIPLDYPGGGQVYDMGSSRVLLLSRLIQTDENFLDVYGISLIAGEGIRHLEDSLSAVVNREFVEYAHWDTSSGWDKVIGRAFRLKEGDGARERIFTVTGICEDFHLHHLKTESMPLILTGYTSFEEKEYMKMTLDLDRLDAATLTALKEQTGLLHFSPSEEELPLVQSYEQLYYDEHDSIVSNKTVMTIAALAMGILTLIGVISYVGAEWEYRRQEIAIRRIHGGTVTQVLVTTAKALIICTLAASAVGSVGAFYASRNWLQDYAMKTSLPLWMYLLCSLGLLCIVGTISYLQSRNIMRGNPIRHLKGLR